MEGSDVKFVQTVLKKLGFNPGRIDEVYGKLTEKAVIAFQKAYGLEADGIVGKLTWDALQKADKAEENKNDKETPIGRFLSWLILQIGCLYVWGAQGQIMTEALIKRRENSARNLKRALKQFFEHVKLCLTLIAYDCSGLIVKYLMDNGLISHDTSANGLYWNYCIHITKDELKAGDLVFKKYRTKNKMYHVGVYMGDGTVIHAKGRDDGVVRESITKTGWNRFGRLKVLVKDQSEPKQVTYTRLLKRMGKLMRGDDVRVVQKRLTELGFDPEGIDGWYGKDTEKAVKAYQTANGLEADGIVGPITWAWLMD